MPPDHQILDRYGLAVIALYFVVLVVLGWRGRVAQKERSLADFYLGGRQLGFGVLLLTLYATQYSGNTLIGFAASAYRQGFYFLVSVAFMMGIIAFYLIYAPKLHRRSRERSYITLSDFIQDRFQFRAFSVLVSVSGIVAMSNYVLSNLKAIGFALAATTGQRVSFAEGVIYLSIIILVYETLGGLRSVAWTDVLQGLILGAGCLVIFSAIMLHFEGWTGITQRLREAQPDFWKPFGFEECRAWFSTLIVVSMGIALYPHAIQRIYAARNADVLRRSLQVMVFLPLATTLLMFGVGLVGAAQFPGLDRAGSESITLRMLNEIAQEAPATRMVIVLFIAGVFAAIMSTVDSALLAISSMITQDLYRPLRPNASQEHLTKVGKLSSWAIMALMAPLAIWLPQTIWRLIEIKVELLIQVAPALLLGLHLSTLGARSVFAGFLAGTGLTLTLILGNLASDGFIPAKPWGLHAGLLGLAANLTVIVIFEWRRVSQFRRAI